VLVLAALLALPGAAAGQRFSLRTVQSPPSPVPAGTVVTYTITATNTDSETFPQIPTFEQDVVLDIFLSKYRSDAAPPTNFRSVTPSQGECTFHREGKPPYVDCTLGTLAPGASATYVADVVAQVSMENRISIQHCTSVNDCGTLALADVDTIVGCTVPNLSGKKLATAKRALKGANCALGKVTRKSARASKRGRVLSQKPAAGTKLAPNGKVAVVIGKR
jgi:hypothetical protein